MTLKRVQCYLSESSRRFARVASRAPSRRFARTVTIWLVYLFAVEAIANAVLRDEGQQRNPDSGFYLHGFMQSLSGAPPLARWDSIWFYGVSREGYKGSGPRSAYTPAFLPLYPAMMRFVSAIAGIDELRAGLWVSRLSLLAVLWLLSQLAADSGATAEGQWPAQFALLAFPTAFILVSAYSESLFLALSLAAFVLARGDRPIAASVASCLASLTRLHGLALIPALALLAWQQRRSGRRSLLVALPAFAASGAYTALAAYFWTITGDPLRYLSAKREFWHTRLAMPWTTIDHAMTQTEIAFARGDLGALYNDLELPCLYLALLVIAVLWMRSAWPEVVYVASCAALSLFSGSLWGLPRFTLVMFPVFTVVAALHRRAVWWNVYLVVGALLQACLLINYVNFRPPAP